MEIANVHPKGKWYQEVKNIMATNRTPPIFIGHCCEIRQNIEKFQLNQSYLLRSETLYDRYLHLLQLQVLLPPPLQQSIDIHGFGAEDKKDIHRMLHGVVNQYCTRNCHEYNIIPNGTMC